MFVSSLLEQSEISESAAAQEIRKRLEEMSIYPYGSAQLQLQESRLERALLRSYRQAKKGHFVTSDSVCSKEGPVAEETERLMLSHYDERAELFENFLDVPYMAYSMAYYGDTFEAIQNSNATLEQAQINKFELFCERAQLTGTEGIFNIGCGFGSLETFLLGKYPEMRMVGLTPSKVQIQHLRAKMADASHVLGQGRFTLLEGGFDTVPLTTLGGNYDVVFSVGVLEHLKNMKAAFERMSIMLKPGGRGFHHLIASEYVIPRFLDTKKTRIDQYFPGGRVWPFTELASQTEYFNLEESWYLNGMNYWRTLDQWHARFWQNIEKISELLDPAAIRHWNDYFSLCKIVFSPLQGEMVGNGQYRFRKR